MDPTFFHLPVPVINQVLADWPLNRPLQNSPHGPQHWMRVASNAIFLLQGGGFDEKFVKHLLPIVKCFALFHDCQREHDGPCAVHGNRAASYVSQKHMLALSKAGISDPIDINLLLTAMVTHTVLEPNSMGCEIKVISGIETGKEPLTAKYDREYGISHKLYSLNHVFVGVCLDADRLDLRRLGYRINPDRLFTPLGKKIARNGDFKHLDLHHQNMQCALVAEPGDEDYVPPASVLEYPKINWRLPANPPVAE